MVGHSTGGGEVARYIGRHGTKRVAKAVLVAAVPPILLKSATNPEGLPIEVFDNLRSALATDRSQAYRDFAPLFYGANRPGAQVSQGTLDQFWLWSMQAGLKNAYESIKAFSETDFTEDLKKFDVPTLVMHGEDDQIVPVKESAKKSAKLIKGAAEIYYPGLPHGLTATHADRRQPRSARVLPAGQAAGRVIRGATAPREAVSRLRQTMRVPVRRDRLAHASHARGSRSCETPGSDHQEHRERGATRRSPVARP